MAAPAWADPERWSALRDGSGCPICLAGIPGDLVLELPAAWVTAPGRTPLPGSVTIFARRHVVEPFELAPHELHAFWNDVVRVAAVLNEQLRPTKLNYEIHGNTIPHLHVNLFPRRIGDRFEGGPIDARETFERTDKEIAQLRELLAPLGRG